MALLKIIYLAHGWHLAKYGRPLIANDFEAWKGGPVVRVVYDCLRGYGGKPIKGRAKKFGISSRSYKVVWYELRPDERRLLEVVYGAYGHLNAFHLSDLTHEPGSPWDTVWNINRQNVNLGMKISNELIRESFLRLCPPEPMH
jgi:uncharacterized phage-associated protein